LLGEIGRRHEGVLVAKFVTLACAFALHHFVLGAGVVEFPDLRRLDEAFDVAGLRTP
jgi:hypothetical protein